MYDLLHYDDVEVGDVFTTTARTVTETDVVNFAGMTGDYTPLHVDHQYARNTPFRQPIAHGLLGLSLLAGMSSRCPNMATSALVSVREWKFLKPIYFGDTLHVKTEVIEKRQHGRRRGEVIWHRELINQDGQVVQSGVFETLVDVAMPQEVTQGEPEVVTISHPAKQSA
jgi:acyl dehydratase